MPATARQPSSGRGRPQPVLTATQVSAVATWIVGLLVIGAARYGFVLGEEITGPLTDLVAVLVVTAAGSLSSLLAGLWARRRVTPTGAPQDDEGRELVPRGDVQFAEPDPEPVAARAAPWPSALPDQEPITAPIPIAGGLDPNAGGSVNINRLRAEYGLGPY
jgi:hypothetical protein